MVLVVFKFVRFPVAFARVGKNGVRRVVET